MAAGKDGEKRRAGGAIRVPFVRRCQLDYGSGQQDSAFIVNINVLGAYVESEKMPALGRAVVCRFQIPGNELELVTHGVVAWTNPQQEHPVHSLPPGFGLAFRNLSPDVRARIEQIVADYLARQSGD
jgi:Tfp pilus assembly protein PilZ